jgi:serine/threonine-protein kinase
VKIQELIGHGGMAEVYLGLHTTLNRPVAVKILHAHLAGDERFLTRTRDEAQAVAALRHPNIVQVYDFDFVDNRPYIVMELIGGMALSDYLDGLHSSGISLPIHVITRLIGPVAEALDYAHARGIVHRDVKPANVMLRQGATPLFSGAPLPSDADPVLTDFGVARIASATTQTATGTMLGTPSYMSPEQVRGENIDSRSDIYSLGIMLYELVAGKLPFDPDTTTPVSILFKQVNEAPPPLPNVSPEIQAVTERALAKDPDDRYQHAGDMAQALQTATQTPTTQTTVKTTSPRPASASRSTPIPATAPPLSDRRNFNVIGGAALGAIILVSAALLGTGVLKKSPDPTTIPNQVETQSQVQIEPSSSALGASPVVSPTSEPTPVPLPVADNTDSHGNVLFQDANLTATISNVEPPPEGFDYTAWLIMSGSDGINLGDLVLIDQELTVNFEDPSGQNLLSQFDEFIISLEPITETQPETYSNPFFTAKVLPETFQRLQLLDDISGNLPYSSALLNGLIAQTAHHDNHLNNAVNSINSSSLEGGKSHSEHVINIIEGREGEMYSDWNENSRIENPGDDVGLLPYLLLMQDHVRGFQMLNTNKELDATIETALLDTEALIQFVEDSRKTALQIALADSLDLIQELDLVGHLSELLMTERVSLLVDSLKAFDLAISAEDIVLSP